MILGIGVDSIEISRVVKAMEKKSILSIAFLRKRNRLDGTHKKERCF